MTIQNFKREAQRRGNYFDNTSNARQEWARTWGLSYHSRLWEYKHYRLGSMEWKGGTVRLRHGSYRSVQCTIDGEPVSEYRFNKALATFVAPEITPEEYDQMAAIAHQRELEYKRMKAERESRRSRARHARRHGSDAGQLHLDFTAA